MTRLLPGESRGGGEDWTGLLGLLAPAAYISTGTSTLLKGLHQSDIVSVLVKEHTHTKAFFPRSVLWISR